MRAERKSTETLKSYDNGARAYLARCEQAGRPAAVDRHQLREFVAALLAEGARPSTAVSRHLAVRRFSACDRGGEQASDPLLGMRAPKLDKPVVEPLTDDQLRAMLKACRGADLRDKRDEAILDDGQSRLVVDGYGFRRADDAEHQRLRRAVGPHGWHVGARKRQIGKQYAAEWALDGSSARFDRGQSRNCLARAPLSGASRPPAASRYPLKRAPSVSPSIRSSCF